MKFVVGILTYNALSSLRWGLLERTGESLCRAFPEDFPWLLDNGSSDGSELAIRETMPFQRHWLHVQCVDGNTSPGRGRNELCRALNLWHPDPDGIIYVLSDDDIEWRPEAAAVLSRFWEAAPADLILLSGLLEPDWPWNKPCEVVDYGGVKALERESAPAAAWTFRGRDFPRIFPLKETLDGDGEDFEACRRLRAAGYRVAQIELGAHIGEGYSQLGNDEARALAGRPLDRERWGLGQ